MTIVHTPEGIEFFRLLSLRGALSLECKGMTRRGRSAYSAVKDMLEVKGRPKKTVLLAMLDEHIDKIKAAQGTPPGNA